MLFGSVNYVAKIDAKGERLVWRLALTGSLRCVAPARGTAT
jgi:hypothetical protein